MAFELAGRLHGTAMYDGPILPSGGFVGRP